SFSKTLPTGSVLSSLPNFLSSGLENVHARPEASAHRYLRGVDLWPACIFVLLPLDRGRRLAGGAHSFMARCTGRRQKNAAGVSGDRCCGGFSCALALRNLDFAITGYGGRSSFGA